MKLMQQLIGVNFLIISEAEAEAEYEKCLRSHLKFREENANSLF